MSLVPALLQRLSSVSPGAPSSGRRLNQIATTAAQTARIAIGTLGTAMRNNKPASPRTAFVCGLIAIGMGLFLLLVGLGVIPVNPRSVHGPMWTISAGGVAFMLAGLSISVGAIHGVSPTGDLPENTGWWMRLFYYVVGLAIVGALASIGTWVAFGAGERNFSGTGFFLLSSEGRNTAGRIIFGFGAVLTWLIAVVLAVSGARKLFKRKSA
jgi:hypothetical protein